MNYVNHRLIFFFLVITNFVGFSQENQYFQGFDKSINGKNFGYHSPFPDVNTSLLVRGRSDYQAIEWITEKIPDNFNEPYSTFIWLYAMDVSSNPSTFVLYINDLAVLQFTNAKQSDLGERVFKSESGIEFFLNATMNDKYMDHMGFAKLRIPINLLKNGKSVNLKIAPVSKDNDAWFMTYETKVKEDISIYQNKVVAKKGEKLFHSISLDFIHIGDNQNLHIEIDSIEKSMNLKTGFNKIEILLPKVEAPTNFLAKIETAGIFHEIPFMLKPVKEWEVYLVQHTHTDIGYTRPQTEILPEHLRYIDNALDYCDQTDDYPDAAKFRWTCETAWSVREYLNTRPQKQIDRLIKRIREGRIEATGMFLNFSEIIDESAMAKQTNYLRILKKYGIDVHTLMQNDVNGIAWSMIDLAQYTDLKYLTMGIHAHRARKPFNQPTAFWWQSPAKNRLLAYRSEHYQHGNALGITGGQQEIFRNNLSAYLSDLENKNYPYDIVSLQFSGYVTDNSPPSVKVCDIIRDWNEKYEWPKLRSALASDFMVFLEEKHADDLAVKEVAWPDWWTDGTASAANETKTVRQVQNKISAVESLFCMGKLMGNHYPHDLQHEIHDIYDQILFYDEHTHGAAESVTDPLSQNTINQWNMKSAYAWEAAKKCALLEEEALALLEQNLPENNFPGIVVYNTLHTQRSGMIDVFLQNELVAEGADFIITDQNGLEMPYQRKEQR